MPSEHSYPDDMNDPRDILPAIDLLMNAKRKRSVPWFVKPLDYVLACLVVLTFWGGTLYLIYKLFQWL